MLREVEGAEKAHFFSHFSTFSTFQLFNLHEIFGQHVPEMTSRILVEIQG